MHDVVPRLRREFAARYGAVPRVFYAPGRANLIGAHVDYNGGAVLPVPIARGTWIAARRRDDDTVRLASLDLDGTPTLAAGDTREAKTLGWAGYVFGMLVYGRRQGLPVAGADVLVAGNLPRSAGLSSSASLEVGAGFAFSQLFGWEMAPVALAELAWEVETGYIGLRCGIMDQFAVALARPGHALHLECATRRWRHVPFPEGCELVVLDTRKPRRLVDSAYNERVAECRAALDVLNRTRSAGPARWLAEFSPANVASCRDMLGDTLWRRARHVTTEVERVRASLAALESGDAVALGHQMSACHASCRDDYEVSCEELDHLVAAVSGLEGVHGARLTGAGFGGCAVAVQRRGALTAAMRQEIATDYEARFGFAPQCHIVAVGAGPAEVA